MTFIIKARLDQDNRKSEAVSSVRDMHDLCAELTSTGWTITDISRNRKGVL